MTVHTLADAGARTAELLVVEDDADFTALVDALLTRLPTLDLEVSYVHSAATATMCGTGPLKTTQPTPWHARDLVDIHRGVLTGSTQKARTSNEVHAFLEEARLRWRELVGYVASHHRASALGVASPPSNPQRLPSPSSTDGTTP